jgi:hypothetical protein
MDVELAGSAVAGARQRRTAQDEFGQRASFGKKFDLPFAMRAYGRGNHDGVFAIGHDLGVERKDREDIPLARSTLPGMIVLRQRAARQGSERRAGHARRRTFGAQTLLRPRHHVVPRLPTARRQECLPHDTCSALGRAAENKSRTRWALVKAMGPTVHACGEIFVNRRQPLPSRQEPVDFPKIVRGNECGGRVSQLIRPL